MNNALFSYPYPANEPVGSYAPDSRDREELQDELKRLAAEEIEIPLIIGGREVCTGDVGEVVMPHDHGHVLATYHRAGEKDVRAAIEAAVEAKKEWERFPWEERAAIAVRIAELLSKKYRYRINAATMLGQSKNVHQAEIDAACENIDFLRFNAHYAGRVYGDQPASERGVINRVEYRPLEGFVLAVTPFNFTAIASNLNMAPVLMGNVCVWKPATTAIYSNYFLMKIFQEAGLPDGVINFLPGSGRLIGDVAFADPRFAGLHFTGSNATFDELWQATARNLPAYRSYPRMVGETGGKNFVLAHPSADVLTLAVALVRGSFEYQGQKCSASSRAYIPANLWPALRESLCNLLANIRTGDVRDFNNFHNAVIDRASFDNIMHYITAAKQASTAEIIFGGRGSCETGYFIEPTVVRVTDPHFITMEEEIFGPVLSIYVYPENRWDEMLPLIDSTSPYGLTGSIFATDRYALHDAAEKLRYAAGNIYFNDKSTGAVVGQQPFGGSRRSGTNDKAGSYLNLLRWVSPRTIKETCVPPTDFRYPFMLDFDVTM
ncbi:MAG: L-glutamate gamma-semialdehyde dehydrogenase [Prevotellaceae bacterium]|jgi:1-pyrroline-5-carboxylate dehydrogenase|nr:L-glutamate gamma-semialdehyde dehydrogenase [Prevotellaceae bacterium]